MAERKQYDYVVPNLNDELNKVYEVKVEAGFERNYLTSSTKVRRHVTVEVGRILVTAGTTNAAAAGITVNPVGKYNDIIYANAIPFGGVDGARYNLSITAISNTFVDFRLTRVDAPVASGVFPPSGVEIFYTLYGAD